MAIKDMDSTVKLANMVYAGLILCCAAENGEANFPTVIAIQKGNEITIRIENHTKHFLYIGNPERCSTVITLKYGKSEGAFSPTVKLQDVQWKHLVVLAPQGEDRPDLWTWSFVVKDDQIDRRKITELGIRLWYAGEEDFKKKTILALKMEELSAKVVQSESPKK